MRSFRATAGEVFCFMRLKDSFAQSAKELKKTRSLAVAAMLLAIAVVLGFFSVQLTESIRISFTFLANELTGMLFGPVVGMLEGGLADIVNYMIKPTGPFFPGFTLTAAISGFIYGLFLYRKNLKWFHVALARITVIVFCHWGLNTLWLSIMGGKAMSLSFTTRILPDLIQLPLDFIVLFAIVSFAKRFPQHLLP